MGTGRAGNGIGVHQVLRPRSFARGSPVADYWLTRCEGFSTAAAGGVGRPSARVEAVVLDDHGLRARALIVRQVLGLWSDLKLEQGVTRHG